MMKIKKFIGDTTLNLIASFIPVIVLQLIIYPIVSRNVSEAEYGLMISIYSMISLVSGTLGGELCNLRLLKNIQYEEKSAIGDFNVILICYCFVLPIVMFIGMRVIQNEIRFIDSILVVCISMTTAMANYFIVAFRLALDYVMIFISNIIASIGYIIGLGLMFVTSYWQCIFLVSDIGVLIFVFIKTDLWKEPKKITKLFRSTLKDSVFLDLAGAFLRMMTYADKIILYPIAGGASVAIYYTAMLFGKIISMGINPLTSVILSYLSNMKKANMKLFNLLLLISSGVCIIGYFICLLLSRPMLSILFPQWVDEAMRLMPVTTLAACLFALCSLLTPLTLKFCSIHWQIVINGISVIAFFSCGYILLKLYGLMGFCIGVNLSYLIRLSMLIYIYIHIPNQQEGGKAD